MAGIVIEFSYFGDFDSFGIIRSETPTSLDNLPSPLVTGLTKMFYVDTSIVDGSTYYYRPVVWRDGEMQVGDETMAIAVSGDPYWSKVVALLHLDGNLVDECGNTWVVQGGMNFVSNDKKFGTGCLYSTGATNSNLHMTSAIPKFLGDDFCVEMFFKPTDSANNRSFFNTYGPSNTTETNLVMSLPGGKLTGSLITITGDNTAKIGEWNHVAYTREGSTLRLFLNGILVGSGTFSGSVRTDALYFGLQPYNSSWAVPGYYDEIRITKGVPRYTKNFTVPNRAFLAF